jgi:hypothetical protein
LQVQGKGAGANLGAVLAFATRLLAPAAIRGSGSPASLAAQDNGFFVNFWRGHYSLPFSFWVVGFFGILLIVFAIGLSLIFFNRADFDPYLLFAYLVAIWLGTGMWALFHGVGTWRSSRRHAARMSAQGKSALWAKLARIVVVGGAMGLVAGFARTATPQLAEGWRIAFRNDPAIPGFALRVMRNGTELEIAGGLKYGLASDFDKLVRAFPLIETVRLDSAGGRIGEAVKLARLIRERGLATYVSRQCLSACTIAFASGRERWLNAGAQLGYHVGAFAGRENAAGMREVLLRAGLPPSFVARVISHSSRQMWYPTEAELLAAHVITGTTDTDGASVSGYGPRRGAWDFGRKGTPVISILDELSNFHLAPVVVSRAAPADGRPSVE